MEKLAFELLNIIAQIEEKQLHEDIKKRAYINWQG